MPQKTTSSRRTRCKSAHVDARKRERLLLEHLPLVRSIARTIHARLPQHVALEDLVQAGVVGLIQAFDNFDSSRQVQLKSYAQLRIRGAIVDSLRELDWSPRSLRAMARRIEGIQASLREKLGRSPEDEEVCGELGIPLSDYLKILASIEGLEIHRLSFGSIEDDVESDLDIEVPDTSREDPFDAYIDVERREALASAMSQLSDREREVLSLYYFNELTMKEVARRIGVGESRISQIHSATLESLRYCMQPGSGSARYSDASPA